MGGDKLMYDYKCPICGSIKSYTNKHHLQRAISLNSNCRSCTARIKGDKLRGVKRGSFTQEHKDKIAKALSKYRTGKSYVDLYGEEGAKRVIEKRALKTRGQKRTPFSDETKRKMSESRKTSKVYQDWMRSDEYRKTRQRINIERFYGITLEEWEGFGDERRKYYNDVRIITKHQDLKSLSDYDKWGNSQADGYHLDHIYPISLGYLNNIFPSIIGDISNLRFIHWKENQIKNNKVLDEEHERFIKSKNT